MLSVLGFGFRVWGVGFRVQGFGFWVQCVGFWGVGCRVKSLVFRV